VYEEWEVINYRDSDGRQSILFSLLGDGDATLEDPSETDGRECQSRSFGDFFSQTESHVKVHTSVSKTPFVLGPVSTGINQEQGANECLV
jgi:hypothetical protein